MAYLFCNVGWMEYYGSENNDDNIVGGGSHADGEGHGFEVCNFAPYENQIYGYVQPPGRKRPNIKSDADTGMKSSISENFEGVKINIDRLGADSNDNFIQNVNVIWTAKHPEGGTCIIGWYVNATVYRKYQKFDQAPPCHQANNVDGYRIVAEESNCTLLPPEQRTFQIPRGGKGEMRANIWYADKPRGKKILEDVIKKYPSLQHWEFSPLDQDATTAKKQPLKPDINMATKDPFLYRVKKAAHKYLPRFFPYPLRPSSLENLGKNDPVLNERSSPPDDEFIDLCGMWAVEFYTPAHVDTLLAGLRKLDSKNKNRFYIDSSSISWIQELRQSPDSYGYMEFGESSQSWALPPHVQYATGALFSLTSSLTCFVIGFVFEEDFSTQFDKALRMDRQTYPKPSGDGNTIYYPEIQKAEHICQIRAEIAELAARWFCENLPGLFSSGILEGNLPTCEFVTLRKAEPFPPRSNGNAHPSEYGYLSVLAMDFSFNTWRSEDIPGLKFTIPQESGRGSPYHSILAIKKSNSDKSVQIRENIDIQIQHLLSRWGILTLLEAYSQHLNAIRDSALFRSKSRPNPVNILEKFGHYVSYSVDIAAVTAELISFTKHPLFSSEIESFKLCDERCSESNHTLTKGLSAAIEKRASWLQKTDQSLRDHLTQYGSLLGAEENVRLQKKIQIFTGIILILTLVMLVLTLVLSWTELQKLWSVVWQWLRNLW